MIIIGIISFEFLLVNIMNMHRLRSDEKPLNTGAEQRRRVVNVPGWSGEGEQRR